MSKYFIEHNKVFVAPDGAREIYDRLPPAQYILRYGPMTGYYLEKNAPFTIPKKIFGDVEERAKRVLKTYFARNTNTGVMLSGDKGSGKTMFARLLSVMAAAQGISTIIINDSFENDAGQTDMGLNKFISDIEERCIVLFDEFEKTFGKDDNQNKVLTLLDGTYQSNKLFLLTTNSRFQISDFILNRPGRVYYHFRYTGVEEEFIREYCEYHLEDKSHIDDFTKLAKVVGRFNFDMLQALVQECNIHGESPIQNYRIMNIDLDGVRDKFSYTLTNKDGQKQTGEHKVSIYDRFYVYWDKGNDDDIPLWFEYTNITKFNQETGTFVYEKDGYTLEMKREQEHRFFLDF